MTDLLHEVYERAKRYQESLEARSVFPTSEAINGLQAFDESLPMESQSPQSTLDLLDTHGSPATVASTAGRYFGFVTGGALPVALASNWLARVWDQNGALFATSPIVSKLESITLNWLIELFGLPKSSGGAFVTGATVANFTALAAARHYLLERKGWNVEAQGLFGAPEIKVVVGDEVHISVLKALSMLGLGRERVIRVPVDAQGRMTDLPPVDDMTIVCIQAGNVNSGSFDPAERICQQAHEQGAWVHVDGAFGLWALASDELAHLGAGIALADSWSTDAHKWLNVPYDSGIALCRYPEALAGAMGASAAYLTMSEQRDPAYFVPEFSRAARVIDVWAVMRTLGKAGLADLFERNCRFARRFAEGLSAAGYTIHNDVVLNQVVVSFGERTPQIIQAIQQDGTLWAGQTVWQGQTAMRISVSSWATTEADIEQSIQAIIRIAQ